MTFLRRIGLGLAGVALAFAGAHDVAAHGVSLDMHHALPENSAFHAGFLVPWTQKVEQEAGGRMRFHVHPAAPAEPAGDGLYGKVRDGDIDLAWTPVRPTSEQFPSLAVFAFPFMVNHAEGASRALAEFARLNDVADREFDGVRVLALQVGDGAQLHWANATASPADVTGRRVGVTTAVEADLLTAMGATPEVLPAAEMASALKSGSLDACLLSWERAGAVGVDQVTRTHLEFGADNIGLTVQMSVLAMNAAAYRGLGDDLKAVFGANSGGETAAWLGRVLEVAAAATRKAAMTRGDAIRQVTSTELARWQEAARAVVLARSRALEQAGVRVPALLESAREQLKVFDPPR